MRKMKMKNTIIYGSRVVNGRHSFFSASSILKKTDYEVTLERKSLGQLNG